MLPTLFQRTIEDLDEVQLTELVGGLLRAEANAVGLPASSFVYSAQVKASDEGLDALVKDVPAGASLFLPQGETGFQFKAVRGTISSLKLGDELEKPGPRRVLQNGGSYILVWGRDLNPKSLREAEEALAEEAAAVSSEPTVAVWPAATVARFCLRFPGVPQSLGLIDFGPVKSLAEWKRSLKSDERPFCADAQRAALVDELRRRLGDGSGGLIARIVGDSGIGKSRAVAEALDVDRLAGLTFYAPTTDGLERFLALLRGYDDLDAILVIDEVGAHDIDRLVEDVAAVGRQIRLVTIGLSGARRLYPGHLDIELGRLSTKTMTELVKAEAALDDRAAQFVAEAVEGYPQMAFEILDEISRNPDAADLSRLAQMRRPRELLERTVPEQFHVPLGVLSLFHSVGCRGDLEFEIEELANDFPVSAADLRRTIRDAEDRYIRLAGRRCYVRPKLVATWLAGEIIEEHGNAVISWIERLSSALQQQFVHQLQNFGSGPSAFRDAISAFIDRNERFRRPDDFDEAAARFLHAAAAVAPTQVATSINALLADASPAQMRAIPRRDLVWALEHLIWWPETYEDAVEALFTLAEHESEDWSNNATGEFVGSFQVSLGGTLVPHSDRLTWLRSKFDDSTPAQLPLIAQAAASGLSSHQTRMSNASYGALEPRDWRPQTADELVDALRGSFDLLLACVDRAEEGTAERRTAVDLLAENLRSLVARGFLDEVETALLGRSWSEDERARLTSQLRDVRRYDEPPATLDARIAALIESLLGSDFEERLGIVLATKPWDLLEDNDWHKTPPVVEQLVAEVIEHRELLRPAILIATTAPDEGSSFQFFLHCAARLGPEAVAEPALAHEPPVWPVVAAALTQITTTSQAEWGDQILKDVLTHAPQEFVGLLRAIPLTSERVGMVVFAIGRGVLSGDDFASLIFGAPIKHLHARDAFRLTEAIGCSAMNGRGMEAALGMLYQWVEDHPDAAHGAAPTASRLLLRAAGTEGRLGNMTAHYVERLIEDVPLNFRTKAEIWCQLARNADIGEAQPTLWLAEKMIEEDPDEAAALILATLATGLERPYPRWTFALESGKLLSMAASATSAESVWARLAQHDDMALRFLLRHIRWSGDEPEPLVRAFLLSERLADLEDEAYVNFSNALGTVSGPFYVATERERDRAKSWLASLSGTPAASWAEKLVGSYDRRLERDRVTEEEEDLFLHG